jgi:hypothetical protein
MGTPTILVLVSNEYPHKEQAEPTESRWARWLSHRHMLWILMGLAFLIGLPSIGLGIVADDVPQRLILQGIWPLEEAADPLFHLFSFMPGQTLDLTPLREMGVLSWLADPEISATFFRPVTALTHILDYQLWPDTFWIQHVHSRVWYALSVGAAFLCFRQYGLAFPIAGLAGLMFTLEEAHGLNMGWLANRNASICLVFGIAAICLHRCWRVSGRLIFGIAGVICFVLAMFSAEAGVGALAYVVAWQLVMDEGRWIRRLMGVIPYLAALLVWLLIYKQLGHGVQWSDVYVDPGTQPLRFAIASAERLPLMVIAQWLQVPIDICNALEPQGRWLLASGAWLATLCIARWLWPLLKARREARFWAIGMCLSFVPLCAAFPMVRVLTFSGLGAFALLAMKTAPWLAGESSLTRFQRALLTLHIPFSGVYLMMIPFIWFGILSILMPTDELPADLSADQTIVLVQTHELAPAAISLVPLIEGRVDRPIPVIMLGSFLAEMNAVRIDANTLELHIDAGWSRVPVERITRSIERPWEVGDPVSLPRFTAKIMAITEDGRPRTVHFIFDSPLEDPSLRWFAYEGLHLVEWSPPHAGEGKKLNPITIDSL